HAGVPTDVRAIGGPVVAGRGRGGRVRPLRGGASIGHPEGIPGTLGLAYGGYLLTSGHVAARLNRAEPGDALLQPAPADGGRLPADRVGTLARFVPLDLDPPVPRASHRNVVDAALARQEERAAASEVRSIGRLRGWRPEGCLDVGSPVQKTGRSTGHTRGRVTALHVTIDVAFGWQTARFERQILTTRMSAAGDSGAIAATEDGLAVGLVCAGSEHATVVNPIEPLGELLGVPLPAP
ncbi:MAG: S1 family peptidase, partial [Actinomycetota bacterium]|nr:S1 family peptidase [Actinomycetota bacterium]